MWEFVMRDVFPGYFTKTEAETSQIWNDSVFMIDANILLNLYRYSESTKTDFLKILMNEKFSESLWIPHRAAEEYLLNRESVISEQEKSYVDTIKTLGTLKSDLEHNRKHPFVSDETMSEFSDIHQKLLDELNNNKKKHSDRYVTDDIKSDLDKIFSSRITTPFDNKELESIFTDGMDRYKNKTPPGYKDSNKAVEDDTFTNKCRKFGDLILWKQIITFAKENHRNIIFITDDRKEDWWHSMNGKTIGARPELVHEFMSETNQLILFYQANRFFDYASRLLKEPVNPESAKEINQISSRNKNREKRKKIYNSIKIAYLHNNEEQKVNNIKLNDSREHMWKLKKRINQYFQDGKITEADEVHEELLLLSEEVNRLTEISKILSVDGEAIIDRLKGFENDFENRTTYRSIF